MTTPETANSHSECPRIVKLETDMPTSLADDIDRCRAAPVLRTIRRVADEHGLETYLVGGAVRDLLLDRSTTDLDFVSVGAGSGIALAKAIADDLGGQTVHVYPKFGTAAVRVPLGDDDLVLEFVGARMESYRSDSRRPIVEEGSLEDDLRRRDFTVNAMAAAMAADSFGELVDPFGGLADLAERLLRTPQDPEATFEDDPLRMVRAARFAAQLRFDIHPDALRAMSARAARVDMLSRERVTDELQKMLCTSEPSVGLRILFEAGILERILPELVDLQGVEAVDGHRHKDNFFHTLQVLDNLAAITSERDGDETCYLRWAALLHDVGKPRTKRFSKSAGWTFHGHEDVGSRMVPGIFKKLKLPTDERLKYVVRLIRLHHRPVALVDEEVTDSAVRRLLFEAGEDIDDLMTLVRADITSKNPHRVQRYLGAFDRVEEKLQRVEEADRLRDFQPPVDGYEIMKTLGIEEGVSIGIIKEAIREAILDGVIPNEHDAAFDLMMKMKDDALRRGELFDEVIRALEGRQRAATGAIKEAVFRDDLPPDHDDAVAYLMRVKDRVLTSSD